jgi:LPXTG-motif cell wall-anchored protein
MTRSARSSWRAAVVAASTLLTLMLPVAVAAHTELETATPVAGSTVPSPFDGPIVLTFSEELAEGSKADLLRAGGDAVAAATVDGPDATMRFELDAPLDPDDYEVEWTGIAIDGHVERGTVAFTVAPPPTLEPTPTPASTPEATPSEAPATPSAEPTLSASPSPSATPTDSTATGGSDVVLPIVIGLLIVLVGAAYLLSRRSRALP